MVCYVVPTVAAAAVYILKQTISNWRESIYYNWYYMLLLGGAIFGVVDHLWNGELFLIGKNVLTDIALGVMITVSISIAWAVMVTLDKTRAEKTNKLSE